MSKKADPKKPKAPTAKSAAKKTSKKTEAPPQVSPEIFEQIVKIRSSVRENFGKAAMAMMMLPRYRTQAIGDLQHLVLEPLMRDRLAMAYPGKKDGETDQGLPPDMLGFAIWASVSQEVDTQIREQIRSGVFPIRLKADDWTSGDINWLLDVVAPSTKATASVIANFRQVVKEGALAIHPVITRLVDKEMTESNAPKAGEAKDDDKLVASAPDGESIN